MITIYTIDGPRKFHNWSDIPEIEFHNTEGPAIVYESEGLKKYEEYWLFNKRHFNKEMWEHELIRLKLKNI